MLKFKKIGTGGSISTNKLIIVIISLTVIIIALGAGVLFAVDYFSTFEKRAALETDTIYPNILINSINVGGLKKEDAIKKLQQDLQEPFSQNKISFVIDDETIDFTYGQFGIKYDIEAAVEKAYNYAREGNINERYEKYERLKMNDVYSFSADFLNEDGQLSEDIVANIRNEIEKNLKDKAYIAPKNATIKRENGSFQVGTEENGRELDLDRAVDIVVEFITIDKADDILIQTPFKESVETPVKELKAKVTKDQMAQVGDLIGSYSTKYSGSGSSGRVINMRVAASRLNGKVLYPGETFSTNKCFGESTPENGYKLAGAYINGKLDQDYGGGVCQVSSTLYNAVLRAEMPVVERANHSLTVGYVPRGFDATLAGDYIDLKFKNDFDIPIYIESYLTDSQVVVNIYGKEIHSAGRTLKFTSTLENNIYKTYKEIYQDGKFVEKVYLSRSSYKNTNGNTSNNSSESRTEPTTKKQTQPTTQAQSSGNSKKTETTTPKNNTQNTQINNSNSNSNNTAKPKVTTPKQETTAPKQETTAPKQETTAPKQETTAPKQETTTPKQEITAPKQETNDNKPKEEPQTPVVEKTPTTQATAVDNSNTAI